MGALREDNQFDSRLEVENAVESEISKRKANCFGYVSSSFEG